jgi:hypothetical protein
MLSLSALPENEFFRNGLWHLRSIDFDFSSHYYRCFITFASNTYFTKRQSIGPPYFWDLMPSDIFYTVLFFE